MSLIIDVSEHQGVFNWNSYKSKISGALIRCGYGKNFTSQDDTQFKRNVEQCTKYNIPIGVYLYSYANSTASAILEASHAARLLDGVTLGLPVFYDLEEPRTAKLAKQIYKVFVSQLKDYPVGLYTGESYYNSYLQGVNAKYIWMAKYGINDGKKHTKPVLKDGAKYQIWQYTSKYGGKSLDMSTVIDSSVFVRTLKSDYEIALEVIDGKWSTGSKRKSALTSAGYNYDTIQHLVNVILVAKDVIAGKYGTGTARKSALQKAGYNYTEVQQIVNKILSTR